MPMVTCTWTHTQPHEYMSTCTQVHGHGGIGIYGHRHIGTQPHASGYMARLVATHDIQFVSGLKLVLYYGPQHRAKSRGVP